MSDLAFEKLLAEQNKEFQEAEAFSSWTPPLGEYIVSCKSVKSDVKKDDAGNPLFPWWKITGVIQEPNMPELDGKEFTAAYVTGRAYGTVKTLANTLINGQVSNLNEANDAIVNCVGALVRVRVSSSWSKKYKKDFVNCDIVDVLSSAPQTDAEPAAQ